MVISPAVNMFCRMGHVEHFVENYMLDDKSRDVRRIERPADDDRVVGSVIMAENTVGLS